MKRIAMKLIPLLLAAALLLSACGKQTDSDSSGVPASTAAPDPYAAYLNRTGTLGITLQAESARREDAAYAKLTDPVGLKVTQEPQPAMPGTDSGAFYTANLTGKAEADLRCLLKIDQIREPFLQAGTYTDYTQLIMGEDGTYGYSATFETGDYYPVCWDLTAVCADGAELSLSGVGRLHKVKTAGFSLRNPAGADAFDACAADLARLLESHNPGLTEAALTLDPATGELALTGRIAAGSQVKLQLVLRWNWSFDAPAGQDSDLADKADTLLGNLMAEAVTPEAAGCAGPDSCDTRVNADLTLTLEPIGE